MSEKYAVKLDDEQRAMLWAVVTKGRDAARVIRRANSLLQVDAGKVDEEVARLFGVSPLTVAATRKRFVAESLPTALYDRPKPGRRPILDGKAEAHLVAVACSPPPEEREVWTMQLLADRVVELGLADSISDETVRLLLKKTMSNRG